MLIWNKDIPFETPGEPSGGAPAATPVAPAEPPANPTDAQPEAVSPSDEWVMGHFDALRVDEDMEEVDPIEVQPSSPIPVQAGIPEGAKPPSEPQGNVPGREPALATPVALAQAQPAPVPQVGAAAQPPAALASQTPSQAPDPTQIMAQIAAGIAAQKAEFIDRLAKDYMPTEKELDDLGFTSEQGKFLARMRAQAQVEATASITQMQAQQLPVFLNGILEARMVNQRREDAFFGQWPGLRQAPQEKLAKVLQSVNSLHPELSGEAWMKKAGEIAHVSLGIPVERPVANGSAAGHQTVRTPGPIVRPNGGLPHLPAGTSTAPAPVAPQLTDSERFFQLLQRSDAGEFET